MKRPLVRILVVAAAGLLGAGLVIGFQSASADEAESTRGSFTLPPGSPTPGDGFTVLSVYKVVAGAQIYSCVANADGTGTWSTPVSRPEALLVRYGRKKRTIHHYAGPRWTSNRDGSTLVGAVAQRVPKDGTIPWLLLSVSVHEDSQPGQELHDVTHISRVNTSGGVGPTGSCVPGTDADRWVSYGADYVFWVPA